jgi:hypothetical protein
VHRTPSGAARHLAGYAVNGWRVWLRVADGKPLGDVRRPQAGDDKSPPSSPIRDAQSSGLEKDRPHTAQREFRPYIIEILQQNGGRQEIHKLLLELERRMEPRFLGGDYRLLTDGEVRWRNAARWERKEMVEDGLLKPNSDRGVWELTGIGMSHSPR